MQIEHIVVIKETREGEGRVALTPSAAGSLVSQGYHILVEDEAGTLCRIAHSVEDHSRQKLFLKNENICINQRMY